MNGMRILTLGVGDAFSARSYSTCLALEAEGEWLLVDCPHPIRKMMSEAAATSGVSIDVGNISAIALTHLHADHSSGLEGFGFYCRFPLNRSGRIFAHPSVLKNLWDGHLYAGMGVALQGPGVAPEVRHLDYFFEVGELNETTSVPVGPFKIKCRPTNHSVPTTAFLIEAGGRTLGYSADTAYDAGLIEWLAQADLIIHETNPGFLHTPYSKLAALPDDLRQKMRLIHYSDAFDPSTSAIESLRQGCCYTV